MDEHLKALSDAIERSEPAIISATQSAGVVRVEWTIGFVWPYDVSAWLCTTTDAERDELRDQPFHEAVFEILVGAGLPVRDLGQLRLTKQSQETVDREYQGSWFYALR